MTLSDWLPYDFDIEFSDTRAFNLKTINIIKKYGYGVCSNAPWPGKHKNVFNWCKLENGLAVGFNENPSKGWSFPVIKIK